MRRSGPVVACALAAIVVIGAAVLRIATPDQTPIADRLLVVLIAAALLLAALLALPRAQAVSWVAATVAAALGAIEVVAAVRVLEPTATGSAWRDLSTIATLSLVAAAWIAAVYAARSWQAASRASRAAVFAVAMGVAGTIAASIWAIAAAGQVVAPGELSPLRTAARIGLVTIAGGLLVGIARDLLPLVRRAFEQSRSAADQGSSGRLWRFVAALADELLPGRVADRRRAAEDERARLAADLHALVLPELRRAAATAEAAGMPAEAQVDLRRALEDVEQLMHERQSIVLEQFGLVAALEWLAERTEERSPLRVELELDDDVPDQPGAIDRVVAGAAFRIALLALDNVVRHAGATTATIRVMANPDGLRLQVLDDGAGMASDSRDGRGIGDMRAAAAASGGTVEVTLGDRSRVEAAWPSGSRRA